MSIVSNKELAENKLILLYIIDKVNIPISNLQITKIILENKFMNYFMLQQLLNELCTSNYLLYKNIDNKAFYTITPLGKQTLSYFTGHIPQGIKGDNQYQWLKGHSSFDKTLAEAPEWLLKLMEREEVLLTPFEGRSIVAGIKEGSRNSTLTSLAGTMRARGMTEEGIYTALLAEKQRKEQSSA